MADLKMENIVVQENGPLLKGILKDLKIRV